MVVPLYNEADVLVELCQRLRAALIECRTTFEIIFVDDGSRDKTAETLDTLAEQFEEVTAVHLSRNFGHQAAIHAGLTHARGDAVVLMDGDLQDPPEAIGKFLEAWQAGYDVAYAIRVDRKEWLGKRMSVCRIPSVVVVHFAHGHPGRCWKFWPGRCPRRANAFNLRRARSLSARLAFVGRLQTNRHPESSAARGTTIIRAFRLAA